MARTAALVLALLGVAGAAMARDLTAALTPTQQLSAQKAAQNVATQQQAAAQRAANGNRLAPPCFIPVSAGKRRLCVATAHRPVPARLPLPGLSSPPPLPHPSPLPLGQTGYYPLATCGVSTDPRVCARGFNAWRSMAECCAPQRGALGAFPSGW